MTTALPPRPAKFTAPSAGKLVARPRLFARLDTACRLPLVWIGATPGAGKTSLLASYLQQAGRPCIWIRLDADDARGDRFPELLARAIGSPRPAGRPAATGAQAATTRQALRAALERLPATAALVLDDYDESVAAWLDPWLALLADEVPAGVTVFVAAALEPPTVLARHRADERIATLGNDDLRLDADECAALLATREGMAPGRAADITRAAAGWAAGLGLLAGDASSAQWPLTEELAGYFAHHVFEPLDAETRNLLLHVAALPVFDAGMAAALSLVTTSRSRLERLVRAHHFVERRGDAGYAIHPLFRAWLRQRCDDELPPARHSNLLERTARLVEVSGDIALAVDLYRDAGAWVPMLNAMHAAVPPSSPTATPTGSPAGWTHCRPPARTPSRAPGCGTDSSVRQPTAAAHCNASKSAGNRSSRPAISPASSRPSTPRCSATPTRTPTCGRPNPGSAGSRHSPARRHSRCRRTSRRGSRSAAPCSCITG
jgi:LuxR family maltose regulon positive regulatory protein